MPPHPPRPANEPFMLWWMPIVALVAPIAWAAWQGVSADADGLSEALMSLLWPGVALYAGALAVLWGGWKIDLE